MGYDNFGLKIGIEGEREFKKALSEINQSFKVLGSEMNLVTSQFDKQDKSIQAISARNNVLNKEIDAQKDKISTLEKALNNATTSFGENDKRTKAWAIQLNNANADLNKMQRELEDNNITLDTAGKEFNEAEQQAGEFGKEIKKSAEHADDASNRFDKLGGVLKGIGTALGAAVAGIGAAAAGAGKALVDMTVGASQYADDILTMSTVTGMSTESLQAYKYAAELVDVSMETLTASMAKQVRSMSSARDGSKTANEAYAKLGVSVADINGELRDSDTFYWETIDALGKVANETERDALAMQIFGKSAQELNPLIAQGSKGISELTEEAKRMGAVMSEDSLNALGAFDDSVQRLKAGAGAAKNMLGTVLLPQLQVLSDSGVALLGEFTKGLSEAGGDWGKISEVIGNTAGGITDLVMESIPKIMELGFEIVSSIGGAIADNLPMLIDSAVSIVMTIFQALIDSLPQISDGALLLVLTLFNGIIENLPSLIEGALLMIVALSTGLADSMPELIPSIVEAVILIVDTIINNMDKILEAAFAIIEGLAIGLINALPRLLEALPLIITSIIDFITSNIPRIVELGIILIVQLGAGLIMAIPKLITSYNQISDSIIKGIGKAAISIVEVGKNIVIGLWDGIASMMSWIKEKISGFVSGIVNNVKGVLGIQSPSTVFAGIGTNMSLGLGEGFAKAMNSVKDDMNNSIPKSFDIDANIRNGTSFGIRGNSNITNTFNIASMIVRNDNDIKNIARELYLLQTRSDRGYAI